MTDGDPARTRPASGMRPRVARVLVIDDDAEVAGMLQSLLSDEFEVTASTRPCEALELLTSGNRYDVILCDVMMPAMTGVDLRERVHADLPDMAARFVFMTGGVPRADVRQLLDALPNVVIEKPFDLESLRDLVRRRAQGDSPARSASRS